MSRCGAGCRCRSAYFGYQLHATCSVVCLERIRHSCEIWVISGLAGGRIKNDCPMLRQHRLIVYAVYRFYTSGCYPRFVVGRHAPGLNSTTRAADWADPSSDVEVESCHRMLSGLWATRESEPRLYLHTTSFHKCRLRLFVKTLPKCHITAASLCFHLCNRS